MREENKRSTFNVQRSKAEYAGLTLRILVGLFFLVTGFTKLMEPAASFAAVIEAYKIIPDAWSLPMAKVLPWAELFIGAFLAAGYFTRASSLGIAVLLMMFLTALSAAKLRGINLAECGCFGGGFGPHLSPEQTMILDFFLLAAAVFVWRTAPKIFSLDRWIEKGRP